MDATAAALQRYQMEGQDVPWLLAHRAEHRATHPALVWDPPGSAPRTWTYQQLWDDVRRLAAGLHARGVRVSDKVLLHADNSPELVLAWLACATVGAVGVTTNTKSVAEEVAWFAQKARCVAAVTQPQYAEVVAAVGPAVTWVAVTEPGVGEPTAQGDHRFVPFDGLFAEVAEWPGREVDPLLPYCIMFTSGTTSKPKGVVHTHANAIWASRTGARNIDLGPEDRYLVYTPFFHVNAQTWSLLPVLGVGATAVLVPKWSSSRFWETVVRHHITHFSLMPFCMSTLMDPDRPHTSLRVGVFGLIVPNAKDVFGCDVYAAYGMTETVIHAISGKPCEHPELMSMGRVTPGYELAVVDQATGELCDVGRSGELWLRGTRGIQLFSEYFDNPEANAKSFEDGWFKTGDVVKMTAGGTVTYVERNADLLKVGGENVSAREVEEVAATVPGVAKVAVVGKKHDFLDQVAVAFVIKSPDAPEEAVLTQQVIDTCAGRLANFKVPQAVYYVDEFPTGNFDKLLKNQLRELADAEPSVD
ncbi:MAG TPA: AMP-binding protein [Acidimicrobiales bacterium]|nr:AMP-binding protein [Acidimicrobiales bacterium]